MYNILLYITVDILQCNILLYNILQYILTQYTTIYYRSQKLTLMSSALLHWHSKFIQSLTRTASYFGIISPSPFISSFNSPPKNMIGNAGISVLSMRHTCKLGMGYENTEHGTADV